MTPTDANEPPNAHDDLEDVTRATLRFLASIEPDLHAHPLLQEAGRCPVCGTIANEVATLWRRRRLAEAIIAIETETFSRLVHGLVLELKLPPHVACGHVPTLPLPAWEGQEGTVYYARRPRRWDEGQPDEDAKGEPGSEGAPSSERGTGDEPAGLMARLSPLAEPGARMVPPLDPPLTIVSVAPLVEDAPVAAKRTLHDPTVDAALAFLEEPPTVVGRPPTDHPEARRDDEITKPCPDLPRPDLARPG
ncbi:MAG: hypothetical protein AAGH15_23860 [Myxococcota bacterium]